MGIAEGTVSWESCFSLYVAYLYRTGTDRFKSLKLLDAFHTCDNDILRAIVSQ